MAKLNSADLLEAFKGMTLLELTGFVKEFEETFGVTAAAPAATGPEPAPGISTPEEDMPAEFDVVLEAAGDKKIMVIKEIRARLGFLQPVQVGIWGLGGQHGRMIVWIG